MSVALIPVALSASVALTVIRSLTCYVANSESLLSAAYFEVADSALSQLSSRFNVQSRGLKTYRQLETSCSVVTCLTESQCPELDETAMCIQLSMFRSQHQYDSLHGAQKVMQSMNTEVRILFPQVEQQRLKTWLRSTMSQTRLNSVAICSVHTEDIDNLNIEALAKEFASRSEIRHGIFGN